MLVDDPVKRVDNMTMAWGLEARVPFLDHEVLELAASVPPELKLAQEGKGVLKEAARRVIPSEVIDRPKGYFPVPALKYLQGPYLDLVRDALHAPRPASAACSRTATSTGCSPTRTTSSPRCGATSSGSSACSSCGCSPTT
jgi:asparagine synthetase B (glutamine-hydrolysing)